MKSRVGRFGGIVASFLLALSASAREVYVFRPGVNTPGGIDTGVSVTTTSFTLETWVYATALPTDNYLFMQYKGGENGDYDFGFRLRGGEGNKPGVFWRNAASAGGNLSLLANTAVELNTWAHVAMVCDGANHTLTLYVNGVASGSCAVKEDAVPEPLGVLRVGYHWYGYVVGAFAGFLREARVWSVARTAAEISANKDRFLSGPQEGLVGCYPLIRDRSGAAENKAGGVDGVLAGGGFEPMEDVPLVAPDEPQVPAGTSYVASLAEGCKPFVTDMKPGFSVFSVEAWVCPADVGTGAVAPLVENNVFCAYKGGGAAGDFVLNLKSGKARVWWRNYGTAELLSSQSVTAGTWTHLAVTSDGNQVKIYVNGEPGGTLARGATQVTLNSQVPLIVGGQTESVPFRGRLSEVRFWSRALTGEEIAASLRKRLTGTETGLAGYWPLDEHTGSVAVNRCANGGTDATGAGVSRVECDAQGPFPNRRQSYAFSDDWAYRSTASKGATDTGLSVSGAEFTFETWVNPDDVIEDQNNVMGIYAKETGDVTLRIEAGRAVAWYRGFAGGDSEVWSSALVRQGAWTHLALVCDGDTLKVYVNGKESGSLSRTAAQPLVPPSAHLFLAGISGSKNFRGLMREARYWNRARSAAEIAGTWRIRMKKPKTGLVGCWPLDGMGGNDPIAVPSLGTAASSPVRNGAWERCYLHLRNGAGLVVMVCGGGSGGSAPVRPPQPSADATFVATCVKDLELEPPSVRTDIDVSKHVFSRLDFAMNDGMARTRGGRLYALWTAGGDSSAAFLVGTWSDDGGATWQGTKFVVDPHLPDNLWQGQAAERCSLIGNLWTAPDGTLRLYASQSVGQFSGRGSCWEFVCRNPDAAQPTWSEAKYLFYGSMHNKPIVAQDGTWLAPMDFEPNKRENFPQLDARRGLWAFASSDGRSWAPRGKVTPNLSHYAEHQFLQKDNGDLWMLMRTGEGLKESFSSDGGRVWSDPAEPTALRQCISRFSFIRLASGRLLFVKNGSTVGEVLTSTPRQKLSAFLSSDGGVTWAGPLMLDERMNVAYPDAFQGGDGFVYVSYDHDRNTAGGDEILFARFTEADVLAGEIVTSGSFLQRVVFSEMRN